MSTVVYAETLFTAQDVADTPERKTLAPVIPLFPEIAVTPDIAATMESEETRAARVAAATKALIGLSQAYLGSAPEANIEALEAVRAHYMGVLTDAERATVVDRANAAIENCVDESDPGTILVF